MISEFRFSLAAAVRAGGWVACGNFDEHSLACMAVAAHKRRPDKTKTRRKHHRQNGHTEKTSARGRYLCGNPKVQEVYPPVDPTGQLTLQWPMTVGGGWPKHKDSERCVLFSKHLPDSRLVLSDFGYHVAAALSMAMGEASLLLETEQQSKGLGFRGTLKPGP